MKRMRVKYTAGYSGKGILLPRFRYKWVVVEGVVKFHNDIHKEYHLGRTARILLDYLTETMDEKNNQVHNNSVVRQHFGALIQKTTGESVSDHTIKSAFKELTSAGLLVFHGPRGSFWVNPLHYYKGSRENRERLIKQLYEKPYLDPHPRSNITKAMPSDPVTKKFSRK